MEISTTRAADATRTVLEEKTMKMVSGSFYIAKEGGLNPQGDDAHFIRDDKQTIGVADGVGGWVMYGVDAGEYARELMYNSVIAIDDTLKGPVNPVRVLKRAYKHTNAKGSSTACIITLTGQFLHAVNIGDSRFMVIREGEIMFRSPIQQRDFNNPYQLGKSFGCDQPNLAQVYMVEVQPGDVIVAATDGLFDNLFKEDIKWLVQRGIEQGKEPQQVAWEIAEDAYKISVNETAVTPFMKAAKKLGATNLARLGGKKDDITVVVSYIVSV